MYRFSIFCLTLFISAGSVFAQQADTVILLVDSSIIADNSIENKILTDQVPSLSSFENSKRMSAGSYFKLLGSNFRHQFTAPFRASGKDWIRVGAFAAITGGLAFADRPVQKIAIDLRGRSTTYTKVSKQITDVGGPYEACLLVGLGTYGLISKDHKMFNTTMLATQAYIIGGGLTMALKSITGRHRPNYIAEDGIAVPHFHGPMLQFEKDELGNKIANEAWESFPSGHTTIVFAAATVYAMEYRDKPIVPILSYSAAGLVGLSRISENKHWVTDVIVGAAIGFFSGRSVVRNYHRHSQTALSSIQKKKDISFNLQFINGRPVPGLVYRF